jgi:hypothetical protein
MLDSSAPASTRVRAADSVLDHAKHAIEIEDIETRVSELEQVRDVATLKASGSGISIRGGDR